MLRQLLITLIAAFLIGASLTAGADDTDIYVDNNANLPPGSQPLVMFSIDYRANLTSTASAEAEAFFRNELEMGARVDELKAIGGGKFVFFDVLILSLEYVLSQVNGVKVGLMFNHNDVNTTVGYQGESPTPTSKRPSNGGVILMGFRSLVQGDTNNARKNFIDKMVALKRLKPNSNSPDHPYQGAELFYEFFRYLTGQKVYNAHSGWIDFESGNLVDTATNMRCGNADSGLALACWDSTIENPSLLAPSNPSSSPPSYISPLSSSSACAKIFTVNFLFQVSQSENDPSIFTTSKANGGLGIATPSTQNDFFPAVTSFLRDADLAGGGFGNAPDIPGEQNVTSYFLVSPSQINNTTIGYAKAGGTNEPLPLSENPRELVDSLLAIFQQILSVSTTLVAASVPVNVFNRSEIVNNVYFALFQAQGNSNDSTVAPGNPVFWPGNLKKLTLQAVDTTDANGKVTGKRTIIADKNGIQAIGADGRIRPEALSSWTSNAGAYLDAGDTNGDGIIDARDGNDPDTIADNRIPPAPAANQSTPANQRDVLSDRDGRYIVRGAAGQQIPGFKQLPATPDATLEVPGDANPADAAAEPPEAGPRKLFYLSQSGCAPGNITCFRPLNVYGAGTPLNELKAQLGNAAMTDAEAQKLLRYARGQDVNDEDADGKLAEARFWLLGDPLHSRPLPINYGKTHGHSSAEKPAIFVVMASNDGYLRMFRNTTPGTELSSAESGKEVWAFMPPEGLSVQRQLMKVDTTKYPIHPYSFDGEPTALIIDEDGDGNIEAGDRVNLYIGLRRGGNQATAESSYYALDITDPLNPKFLWRIRRGFRTTAEAGEQATTDFNELGFTFSRPRVGAVRVGQNPDGSVIRRIALFFGGGYDGGYTGALDAGTPPKPVRLGNDIDGAMADDNLGNAIYVIRANNAELIWKAVGPNSTASPGPKVFKHPQLRDSIASNLTVIDTDADGAQDRIVVGDLGGNVWRADLGPDTDGAPAPLNQANITDDWQLTRLACLGRHGGPGCTDANVRIDDRRFFHEVDIVQGSDELGRFDAVVIGSGDRADPLDQGGDVNNRLYVIKDRRTGQPSAAQPIEDLELTNASLQDITNLCLSNTTCPAIPNGWFLELEEPNGEKNLSAPITIANVVFFTTYLPPPPPDPNAVSCGPQEGNGFLYAVHLEDGSPAYNYDTTTGEGGKEDRKVQLDTPGIPAQVVYLGSPNALSEDKQPGGGCTVNILAGASIFDAPGCPRFRTFWQRE